MFGSFAVLFVIPWLDRSSVRSSHFSPIFTMFIWILIADCVLLGYLGAMPAEGIYVILSRIATAYYFFHFLILFPLLPYIEKTKPLPISISEPVLSGSSPASAFAFREKK